MTTWQLLAGFLTVVPESTTYGMLATLLRGIHTHHSDPRIANGHRSRQNKLFFLAVPLNINWTPTALAPYHYKIQSSSIQLSPCFQSRVSMVISPGKQKKMSSSTSSTNFHSLFSPKSEQVYFYIWRQKRQHILNNQKIYIALAI